MWSIPVHRWTSDDGFSDSITVAEGADYVSLQVGGPTIVEGDQMAYQLSPARARALATALREALDRLDPTGRDEWL